MGIAERIKEKRKSNGLTQTQLADLVGVSSMSLRRWEWGERVPSADIVPKLAEILKTSVVYLMEGSNDKDISHVTKQENPKELPGMAYWGGVVDNAKNIAVYGDEEEKSDVSQMLKKALSYFFKGKEASQTASLTANMGGHHNENNLNFGMGAI